MNPPVTTSDLPPILQSLDTAVQGLIIQAAHAHSPWEVTTLLCVLAEFCHGPQNAITILSAMAATGKASFYRKDGTPLNAQAEEGWEAEANDYVVIEPCTPHDLQLNMDVTVSDSA